MNRTRLTLMKRFLHIIRNARYDVPWWNDAESTVLLSSYGLYKDDLMRRKVLMTSDRAQLKMRIEVLEEVGANLTPKNMERFTDIFNGNVNELERKGVIKYAFMEKHLLSHLEPFDYDHSALLPSKESIARIRKPIKQYWRREIEAARSLDENIIAEWPSNAEEEKGCTIYIAYQKVMRQYYAWRLESDLFTIDRLMHHYRTSTGVRSVRSLKITLDILENQMFIPKEKIIRNFFLVNIPPERLEEKMQRLKTIGGVDLITAVNKYPKLMVKSVNQICEIEEILKESGISSQAKSYRLYMFTFNVNTVRQRLKFIKNDPDLAVFIDHYRICNLIHCFSKARARLQELKDRGHKCFSLNVLLSNENAYQNYLADGVDKTYFLFDTVHYLTCVLRVPQKEVHKRLIRSPMTHFIPLSEVKRTTEKLLMAGYSTDLILEALPVTIYPWEKVRSTLEMIKISDELKRHGFDQGFVTDVTSSYTCGSTNRDKRLLLTLYLMERQFHFTGEGALCTT